jgi:phospholipase A1
MTAPGYIGRGTRLLLLALLASASSSVRAEPTPSPFTMYRSNYFLTGYRVPAGAAAHPDVKFQISVRYELLSDAPARYRLLLAYTQKSFWNIYDASGPFRESNYNPEVFLQAHPRAQPLPYFRFGLAHESNGLGGASSRSWDRAFVETRFDAGAFSLLPMLWWPFRLAENPEILRSFGFGKLAARFRLDDNVRVEAAGHLGSRLDRGSIVVALDVASWLRLFGMNEQKWFTPHIYVQLWHGYGESLIDYDVSSTAARLGLVLRP